MRLYRDAPGSAWRAMLNPLGGAGGPRTSLTTEGGRRANRAATTYSDILMWGLSTILALYLLASVVSSLLGGAVQLASSGAAVTAGTAAQGGRTAQRVDSAARSMVDTIQESAGEVISDIREGATSLGPSSRSMSEDGEPRECRLSSLDRVTGVGRRRPGLPVR
jgi:hypothetical protein